jgi:uncharacterized protein
MHESMTISGRWRTLGRVTLFCVGCAVVLAVASRLIPKLPGQWSQVVVGAVASLGAFVLTMVFVRWEGLRLEDVGAVPGRQSAPRVALGFLIGLLLVALQSALVAVSGHVRWVREPEGAFTQAAVALLVYLVLACREELAFRGYPLRSLDRAIGPWGAQLIVALFFALEHVAGGVTWPHALLGAGVGSVLFGMAALTTKGLAMPIGLHAAWNFGDWVLGNKGERGVWRAVIENGYEARVERVRNITYLVVMGTAILAFCFYRRMNRSPSVARDQEA